MTIRKTIECDGQDCFIDIDVEDDSKSIQATIRNFDWHVVEYKHYCPFCWKEIKGGFMMMTD